MDYNRHIPADSRVIFYGVDRVLYRGHNRFATDDPLAARIVWVIRYGQNGETHAPQADAIQQGITMIEPRPNFQGPANNLLPAQPPPLTMPTAQQTAAPQSPPLAPAAPPTTPSTQAEPDTDPFGGLGPLPGACKRCKRMKKGCDATQRRPCGRCAAQGLSAAECVQPDGRSKSVSRKNNNNNGNQGGGGAVGLSRKNAQGGIQKLGPSAKTIAGKTTRTRR